MEASSERINVVFPRGVAEELRAAVPARQRSQFIAQAVAEKLARLRQTRAIREAAGAWSDEDHPDLMTPEDYDVWIGRLRSGWEDRIRDLGLDEGGSNVSSRY